MRWTSIVRCSSASWPRAIRPGEGRKTFCAMQGLSRGSQTNNVRNEQAVFVGGSGGGCQMRCEKSVLPGPCRVPQRGEDALGPHRLIMAWTDPAGIKDLTRKHAASLVSICIEVMLPLALSLSQYDAAPSHVSSYSLHSGVFYITSQGPR